MGVDFSGSFPWRRWWGRGDEPLELLGGATLPDPEAEIGIAINPDLRLLTDLTDVPVIVLLGDAGMGKSDELRAEHARLDDGGAASPSARADTALAVVSCDLASGRAAANNVSSLRRPLLRGGDSCAARAVLYPSASIASATSPAAASGIAVAASSNDG